MKKFKKNSTIFISIIIALFSGFCSSCNNSENKSELKDTIALKWKTEQVFKIPESVFFDTVRNCIYVSNINGNPSDLDSNGFISKLSENGEVLELEWIKSLSAPKGMAVYGNKLFVSDINYLREIDINTKQITNSYFAESSEFLNDVEVDENGNVYASDISVNKIYILENNKLNVWIDSQDLNHPNGLFYKKGKMYVGSGNAILEIPLDSKAITVLHNNTGSIDGLEAINETDFIISDWMGNINIVYSNDSLNLVLTTEKQEINSADIDFVVSKKLLLVPTFKDNRIVAYNLSMEF